jgi:hypothetical protein
MNKTLPRNIRKICLVFLVQESFDCVTHFEKAFRENKFDVEIIKIPLRWRFDRKYVKELKALLIEKSQSHFVFFSPQSTELFLIDADFEVVYSAYRSWFNANRMRVIPHLWAPAMPGVSIEGLRWTSKPSLRIGFMGRTYANYWLTKIILKFPKCFKHWLLRGSFLKYPSVVALLNEFGGFFTKAIGTFARVEVLRTLRAKIYEYQNVDLDIVENEKFHGTEQELAAYMQHLDRNTYIVCPRGSENFSYRIYEALGHGRIPVIIDTDMVLPKEIDWDSVSVRVPYQSLDKIYDLIIADYHSHSEKEFLERQQVALSTMAELKSMRWIKKLSSEVSTIVSAVDGFRVEQPVADVVQPKSQQASSLSTPLE